LAIIQQQPISLTVIIHPISKNYVKQPVLVHISQNNSLSILCIISSCKLSKVRNCSVVVVLIW
jgi:hypothetical protein